MIKRWNNAKQEFIENPKVDAFLSEVWAVCEKHGMSIGHEDGHGAFIVQPLEQNNKDWLFDAHDET
jgi:hypothetical protein